LRILLGARTTCFPPGSQFRYSNSGYALLALIVEQRSGQTFARCLREHIFAPLQMTGTLAYEQGSSVVPNRAFGYSLKSNSLSPSDGERARVRGQWCSTAWLRLRERRFAPKAFGV
jgi:CubicO group peptidase (beta-lactamase class C family)